MQVPVDLLHGSSLVTVLIGWEEEVEETIDAIPWGSNMDRGVYGRRVWRWWEERWDVR
jgi:hypothetical protein